MNTSDQTPELMLELNYEDRRSQLFRLVTDEGIIMYYEESDIPDLNRPVGLENSVPLYYSLESAWKAISAFVSQTRFNNRLSWHEASCDWLQLKPSYVHTLIRPFIMRSLSEQTRKTESFLLITIQCQSAPNNLHFSYYVLKKSNVKTHVVSIVNLLRRYTKYDFSTLLC